MNILVTQLVVSQGELARTSADVAVLVEVGFDLPIERRDQTEAADVELSASVEQWVVNIFLDDARRFEMAVLYDQVFYQSEVGFNSDILASIRVLARLDDPDVVWVVGLRIEVAFELPELRVALPFFDVESNRERVKNIER